MPPPKAGPSPLGGGGCLPKVVGWDRRASPPSGGDPGRVGWGGRACSRLPAAGRPASLALMGASEPSCARTTFVPSPTSLRRALLSVPAPPTPVLDCPRPPCLGAAAKPGASGRAVGLAVGSGGGTCARGPRPGQPRCTGDLGSARRGKRWAGARSRGRGANPPPTPRAETRFSSLRVGPAAAATWFQPHSALQGPRATSPRHVCHSRDLAANVRAARGETATCSGCHWSHICHRPGPPGGRSAGPGSLWLWREVRARQPREPLPGAASE